MKKSVIVFVLIAVVISAIFSVSVFSEDTAVLPVPDDVYTVWDGSADRDWYNASEHRGTEDDPYVIGSAGELYGLSLLVSEGNSFDGRYFVLENDLYLNELPASLSTDVILKWANSSERTEWTPIGTASTHFKGSFDGQGHTIFGLYINSSQYAGLFGYTENAKVSNLSVSRSYISSSSYAGSVIAYMFVLNDTSTLKNCYSDAYVSARASSIYAGGLVGYAYAYRGNVSFENCINRGEIVFSSTYSLGVAVGGIIGYARSLHDYGYGAYFKVEGCTNSGNIKNTVSLHKDVSTGGIIGMAEARNSALSVTLCKNSGEIEGKGCTGGIVGHLSANVTSNSSACLSKCANIAAVSGDGYTGGLVGAMESSLSTAIPEAPVVYIEQSYNSGVVIGNGATGGLTGAMLSYGTNLALRDSFSTGRVWSTFDASTELSMGVTDVSVSYGGAAALVGKVITGTMDGTVVELSRLYTTAECYEKTANAPSGYIIGNCYCRRDAANLIINLIFYPKTGSSAIGRFTGIPNADFYYRGLDETEFTLKNSFIGYDFNNIWELSTTEFISAPVLSAVEYEKTVCSHSDSRWETVIPATCTEDGQQVFSCELCGELLASEVIPATGHTPGGWFVTTEATCTEDGTRSRFCVVCGEALEVEKIPSTGHNPTDWTLAGKPTCTEPGFDAIICLTCGSILESRQIAALGHVFVSETVKEATYSEAGLIRQTCERCGITEEIVVHAIVCEHERTETKVEKEATCAESGLRVTVCLVCGETLSEEITEKPPHEETEVVTIKEATCTEDGQNELRCKVCGEVLSTEVIKATGHIAGDWTVVIPATCLEGGEDRKFCTVCGEILIIRQTAALGHTPGEPIVTTPTTCTESGKGEYRCIRCGKLISTFDIPAAGHTSGEPVTTPPTCNEPGRNDCFCTVCGLLLTTEEIPATGHSPETVKKDPSCKDAGYERSVCALCGEILSEKALPATGHTFVIEEADGTTVKRCNVCGQTEGAATEATTATENVPPVSTTTMVLILIGIITVFAVVCIVVILLSNRKNRLDK